MYPKFDKHIETASLTKEDAEILVGSVWLDGHMLSVEEIMADPSLSRVIRTRDIDTGEMTSKVHAKTHDGKPLPYFVTKAYR